ncbi:hypothetical protein JXB41_08140 [Candidatus Woesearchaeota archaeon]|nr:hypothetical protein [Candidatus Woesearchaeota archaeon]
MKKRFILIATVLFILNILLINAPPPVPHPVTGIVYYIDEITQVPSGIPVRITDLNNSNIVNTQTWGPIPPLSGIYSSNIPGNTGDTIRIRAWDSTHYGETITLLLSTTTYADVILNMSRDSETMVEIIYPVNHSVFETGDKVNVTANITILGNNGIDCNATLDLSLPNIFLTQEQMTLDIGDINLGESMIVIWNLTANTTGTVTITVYANCSSDGLNLEHKSSDTVVNISATDSNPPNITIISPENNSRVNNPAWFFYIVNDGSGIENCSLIINDVIHDTAYSPEKNATLNFSFILTEKHNWWSINCTDDSPSKRQGTSGIYNLTLNGIPSIILLSVENPVDLVAASVKSVSCNGTITDNDGYNDILNVNATLFSPDYGQDEESPDNNSIHYTNTSCVLFNQAGNNSDFNCSFDMQYYSLNSTWQCNITVIDVLNATNSSKINTTVNELLAIDISPSVLDYGDLGINEISGTDILANVTNFGNVKIDLELWGYALVQTDNLSMDCTTGNISIGYQRFNLTQFESWDDMTPLQGMQNKTTLGFDLEPGTEAGESFKETYWKLKIPQFTSGTCNGKIVFTALNG